MNLIINVALTGMIPMQADNPYLPVTPVEIAADIKRCYEAGATIFHIHARDENGNPTWRKEIYDEIIIETRQLVPDAIICGSTSGRLWSDVERRAEVLNTDIQMASLTLGSLNFISGPSVNAPETIKTLAGLMKEKAIVPELEIFEMGMLDYSYYLMEKGLLQPPFYFNFLLGSLGTMQATIKNLTALIDNLPDNAIWAATGIGRYQFEVNCWAIGLGGHVRVGLEDSTWMDRDKNDPASNVRQVERAVKVARSMGRDIATTGDVRSLLWSH